MTLKLTALGLVTTASILFAQNEARGLKPDPKLTQSFPGLTFFSPDGARLYHDPKGARLLVDPGKRIDEEDPAPVLETRFDAGGKMCRIGFTWGPSEDPGYSIEIRDAAGAWITAEDYLSAESLIVPGNGFVYAAGRANAMFDKRRKYRLLGGKLVEVAQPLYRVDVESKVKAPIELRSVPGKGAGKVVARLGVGSTVHVLANQGDNYLISTPFGLTGWLYLEEVLAAQSPLTEIYYAGD